MFRSELGQLRVDAETFELLTVYAVLGVQRFRLLVHHGIENGYVAVASKRQPPAEHLVEHLKSPSECGEINASQLQNCSPAPFGALAGDASIAMALGTLTATGSMTSARAGHNSEIPPRRQQRPALRSTYSEPWR
jgi:hypothetical protein